MRERDERIGILHRESVGVGGVAAKRAEEHIGVAVGDLEKSAQEHRENEENGKLAILEERKSLDIEHLGDRGAALRLVGLTGGHRERVTRQDEANDARGEELHIGILHRNHIDFHEIGNEHAADKSESAENADVGESLHGIHCILDQHIERYRIGE